MKAKAKPANYVTVAQPYSNNKDHEVTIFVGKEKFIHASKIYVHAKRAETAARKISEATGLPFIETVAK